MKRKQITNKKICRKCGELKELLMFGKWGKSKVCLTCEEEQQAKKNHEEKDEPRN